MNTARLHLSEIFALGALLSWFRSARRWPGGCLCERLPGGGFVEHLRVVYVDKGRANRGAGDLRGQRLRR